MPILLPSALLVGARFPTDAKYWVQTYDDLNDGYTYEGMHRWVKTGAQAGKEFVLNQSQLWVEVGAGQGSAGTIAIGSVTSGNIASVVNVGTPENARLNIILPRGDTGLTPIIQIGQVTPGTIASVTNDGTIDTAVLSFVLPKGDNGQSIWLAYADDVDGQNPSTSSVNKDYVSFKQSIDEPLLTSFTGWTRFSGKSVYTAYAQSVGGLNRSFTLSPDSTHISYINTVNQPLLTSFNTWVPISGAGGVTIQLLSAFGAGTDKGLTQAFLTDQLQYPTTSDKYPGQQVGNMTTNFNMRGKSIIEIINKIVEAPFTAAVAYISGGGLYEKGTSVTVSLTYGFVANSEVIDSKNIHKNGAILQSLVANSGTITDAGVTADSTYYTQALVGASPRNSGTAYASFVAPSFYGIVSSLTPSMAEMKALTKEVSIANVRPLTFYNNNQRVAFAYPTSLTDTEDIRDPSNFPTLPAWTKSYVSYTLADGTTSENYVLYVLTNPAGDGNAFTFTFNR